MAFLDVAQAEIVKARHERLAEGVRARHGERRRSGSGGVGGNDAAAAL